MIITTTGNIEGKQIIEYTGVVFGEVIAGIDFIKDFSAGLTNFFGGRSDAYEGELLEARSKALQEMEQRAINMGSNAIIGMKMDYEVLGAGNNMLMVTCSGTAVRIQ